MNCGRDSGKGRTAQEGNCAAREGEAQKKLARRKLHKNRGLGMLARGKSRPERCKRTKFGQGSMKQEENSKKKEQI